MDKMVNPVSPSNLLCLMIMPMLKFTFIVIFHFVILILNSVNRFVTDPETSKREEDDDQLVKMVMALHLWVHSKLQKKLTEDKLNKKHNKNIRFSKKKDKKNKDIHKT